ncbi:TniQ family protein [Roseovarius sp. EL26]|uniref:TniQ family protein n=1 Tax=Roseovarius sp. EL26 TaxID=2126672 RepID=UPI000EA29AE9|nr:TniQ family protein [Roseovarius sp. EL26]
MKRLQPFLPMLPGESLVSLVSRYGRYHCNMSAMAFSPFMGMKRQDVVCVKDYVVERMHELSGISTDRLMQGSYQKIGPRYYLHRGEEFHSEFLAANRITYCPQCILNNLEASQCSEGLPVGLINWAFSPVRTCTAHSSPLVRERTLKAGIPFLDVAAHLPDRAKLSKIVDLSEKREASSLQMYVENRLAGGSGPSWLDGQQIDLATRATEMLGACIAFGAFVNLPTLNQAQWDTAASIGFEYVSQGEQGIMEGLEEVQRVASCSKIHAGPQAVFGVLYQWIQFKKNTKPVGPFRDVFREHILDTIPLATGVNLFGEPVAHRRRHSVSSLSRKHNMNPKTVQNALMVGGLLDQNYDPARDLGDVSAAKAEALLNKLKHSVPVSRVPEYLGCKRPLVTALLQEGILKPIAGGRDGRRSIAQGIHAADLDAFLGLIRVSGSCVLKPSHRMHSVTKTAEKLRVQTFDIVKKILDRNLEQVELLGVDPKFDSILVHVDEVAAKLGVLEGKPGMTLSETARTLGLSSRTVEFLMQASPNGEAPVLQICGQFRHMGKFRKLVDPCSITKFRLGFRRLTDVAKNLNLPKPVARKTLQENGVLPVWDPKNLGSEIYRRQDL